MKLLHFSVLQFVTTIIDSSDNELRLIYLSNNIRKKRLIFSSIFCLNKNQEEKVKLIFFFHCCFSETIRKFYPKKKKKKKERSSIKLRADYCLLVACLSNAEIVE